MPLEPFYAIDARLARADYHLRTIKRMAREYYRSDDHLISGEYDANKFQTELNHSSPIPDARLQAIIGECVHDLRSSLDHLAWLMVEKVHPGATNESTAFPISKGGPTANKKGVQPPPNIGGGASLAARRVIRDNQPYIVTPNAPDTDALWILHRLWIVDKHRYIAIRGTRIENLNIVADTGQFLNLLDSFVFHTELVSVSEYRAKFRVVSDTPGMKVDGALSLHVALEEPPGMHPPLMDTLIDARDRVRKIVNEASELPELQ